MKIDSAHSIPSHPKCGNVHGHTWRIVAEFESKKLRNGMVVDFGKAKEIVKELDHKNLNDTLNVPTAENLAHYLYETFVLAGLPTPIYVRVYESETCWAEFQPKDKPWWQK